MNVLYAHKAPPRCPASDLDGRCRSSATVTITLRSVLGTEAFLDVCLYHADVLEAVD